MPRVVTHITTPRIAWSWRYGAVYWRVTKAFVPFCELCVAGVCWQREEWARGGQGKVVIHGHRPN